MKHSTLPRSGRRPHDTSLNRPRPSDLTARSLCIVGLAWATEGARPRAYIRHRVLAPLPQRGNVYSRFNAWIPAIVPPNHKQFVCRSYACRSRAVRSGGDLSNCPMTSFVLRRFQWPGSPRSMQKITRSSMTLTFGRIYRSSSGPHVLWLWAVYVGPPGRRHNYVAADSLSEAIAAWVVQQVPSIRAGPYREAATNCRTPSSAISALCNVAEWERLYLLFCLGGE